MKRYVLKTLGCKANLSDSQVLESELQNQGWAPQALKGEEVELCIINSCTVTDEADKQTRKLATRLARENPNAKIVVTGCGAEVDPEGLLKTKGVHWVVGNQNKPDFVPLVLNQLASSAAIGSDILQQKILGSVENYSSILSKHPHDREWPAAEESFVRPPVSLEAGFSRKTRAFLKIQEGCNAFCTYCIIPYGRGPSRSLSLQKVLEQVQSLVEDGVREVIITGTNIGDYGTDLPDSEEKPSLDFLLEQILTQTSLERLRVSSLDPTEITPRILSLMKSDPRFCPHFHVSLQSPHSRILRLMKRQYGFEQVQKTLEAIAEIRSLPGGVFVGMDVITGFPGESDEEFEWGVQALQNLPWTRLHVFPYSERAGTPATRLPDSVPQSTRVQRTKILNQLSLRRLTEHYRSLLNQTLDRVLLEKFQSDGQWVAGYTSNYLRVLFPAAQLGMDLKQAQNQLLKAKPLEVIIDSKASDVAFVGQLLQN